MKKERNSSIELLKIIAMIMIIISHSVPFGAYSNYSSFINLNSSTYNISNLILVIFRYLGSIGNCLFIICSSYYLVNKDKINIKKVIKIIIDTTIISILIMVLFKFGFKIDNAFTTKELIKMCLPIAFSTYWFITVYLLFYIISPLLNKAISSIDKKHHFLYTLFLIILSTINTLKEGTMYYNELTGFITLYFIVSYIKKYYNEIEKKTNS